MHRDKIEAQLSLDLDLSDAEFEKICPPSAEGSGTPPSDSSTLEEARRWVLAKRAKGVGCPCCGQFAKIYKRKLNSFMAYALVLIERYFQTARVDEWLHVPSFLIKNSCSDRECAKLVYWDLITPHYAEREDGGKHAGYYRITQRGRDFVRSKITLPRYVYLYNGELLGFSDDGEISIRDALGDKFRYSELMMEYVPSGF
jgi:hypothetical protein